MRCIINVAIGGRYPKEQKRLSESLSKHFQGDFLSWTEFPNDNYNKANAYNAKAAAFEEAMKKGYTQILWVDSPVVALKAVGPIFDSIVQHGYLTMKNGKYNCAQTCSDACLAYFKIHRDQAETFQEHAGGIIGIDTTHPKGKQLIDLFIQACKDGACDGSRKHDGQSKDPRFKFHRQCQSVISLAANTLGLSPTMNWDTSTITLHPNKKTEHTILCWSHRGKHTLNSTTKRNIRRKLHSGGTRKQNKSEESYIYFIARSGFNDILIQMNECLTYAIQHKRSIIMRFLAYSATDLSTLFDFSNFPVPIYTNYEQKIKELSNRPVEPPSYGPLNTNYSYEELSTTPIRFMIDKEYPRNTVLIYSHDIIKGFKHHIISTMNVMSSFRFTKEFIQMYNDFKIKYGIPEVYKAAHLRATDRELKIKKIIGLDETKLYDIIQEDPMKTIENFIQMDPKLPVYIASDNTDMLNMLIEKYPNVINTRPDERRQRPNAKQIFRSLHHPRGRKDPNNLKEAIIDLLILGSAKSLIVTDGGYSELAASLVTHPEIIQKLLS